MWTGNNEESSGWSGIRKSEVEKDSVRVIKFAFPR